jgi:glyoxylase-like metal-dependent hydrolase (beta-lactamase superfamily II)
MIAALFAVMLLAGCAGGEDTAPAADPAPVPVDANAAVSAAVDAMGTADLDSITYSGSAWRIRNSFRQTPKASPPWDLRDDITNYVRTIDLTGPASRATGETFAQGMFFTPAVEGAYTQNVAADQTGWGQQLEIWLTPWGFLSGAEANGAEAVSQMIDGSEYTIVTWMSPDTQTSPSGMQYTVNGYINGQNQVERVETWVEDAFMGDLHVEAIFGDYQDFGGVMVPTTMEQQRGGGGIFGVTVTDASANPADVAELVTPPAAGGRGGRGGGRGGRGGAAAPTDLAEELADGVYLITGGYVSLAVEFSDHIVVFEGGQAEARGQTVIDEVKRVIPDKPIRYVVNSHQHSDHTAGLAPFVREGATIITHESNVAFLEMALSTPRTLLGEETMSPVFEGAGDVMVLEDETMRFELHHIPNGHTDGMLYGLLPEHGIMLQADFTLPAAGAEANPFVVELAEQVAAQGIEFDSYLGVHASAAPQTKADLMATIGQ